MASLPHFDCVAGAQAAQRLKRQHEVDQQRVDDVVGVRAAIRLQRQHEVDQSIALTPDVNATDAGDATLQRDGIDLPVLVEQTGNADGSECVVCLVAPRTHAFVHGESAHAQRGSVEAWLQRQRIRMHKLMCSACAEAAGWCRRWLPHLPSPRADSDGSLRLSICLRW